MSDTATIANAIAAMLATVPGVGRIHTQKYAEIRRDQFDALFLEIQPAGSTIGALGSNTNGVAVTITVPDGSLYSEGQRLQFNEDGTVDARGGWGYGVTSVSGNTVTLDYAPSAHVAADTTIEPHTPGTVNAWFVYFRRARAESVRQATEAEVAFELVIEGIYAAQTRDGGDSDITFRELWEAVQREVSSHRACSGACHRQTACSVDETGTDRFFSMYLCHLVAMSLTCVVIRDGAIEP